MSLDRADVQHAAKEMCTKMASPTQGSWKRLKKPGKCVKGVEKVTWAMRAWKHDEEMNVDSDSANRSGGMTMINGTVVKHWLRTQASRALSKAQAEYYAVVTGVAEGLGVWSMMTDLGKSAQGSSVD